MQAQGRGPFNGRTYFFFLPLAAGLEAFFAFFGFLADLLAAGRATFIRGSLVTVGIWGMLPGPWRHGEVISGHAGPQQAI